ncbi:MAG: hypothetical protein EBY81_08995, partial [Verrucomicrobia bacterium]|nr:hypothetical protein [Verrucomicrobiota bacterium]
MLRLRKAFQIVALTAGALCSWTNISSAASVTWDGGGTDNNWTTSANWTGGGGGTAPNGNDTINFAGTARLSNTNNFTYTSAAGTNVSIDFNAGAGAFTLNGNQMALTAGVTNNSANIQTLNLNIALAGANTLTKTGANDLILTA